MTNSTAPPQQPNRPEGLREDLDIALGSNIGDELLNDLYYEKAVVDILDAIRTRIERAIPQPDKYVKYNSDCLEGYQLAVKDFKSNIQRELGI